jgi:lipopolysaccharide/colanic/teichoic acid biosynthesis glycosyltransferase
VEIADTRTPKLLLDDMPHARSLLHDDERLAPKLVHRDLSSGERVVGRHGEHDLVARQRLELEGAVTPERADDSQLELPLGDPLDDRLGIRDREGHLHPRVIALEVAKEKRDEVRSRARGRADRERPLKLAAGLLLELGKQLSLELKEALGSAIEPEAGFRRLDTATRSVEELSAQALLERPNLEAHRRLRHTETLRGLREAPALDDLAERGELPRIHKESLCPGRPDQPTTRVSSGAVRQSGSRAVPSRAPASLADHEIMASSVPRAQTTPYADFLAREAPGARRVDAALRGLAMLISGLSLLALAPVWLLTAAAILATSGRPVFYRGVRVGLFGRRFTMLKFRTLRADAETRLGPYYGEELTMRTAGEVTGLGRWLRASQLDEIPQLWNVLRGDMSIVGPRPIRPALFEEVVSEVPQYWQRLVVRPGLTGFAQTRMGREESWGEKLAHDLEYIADRSVRLYLRVVAATAWRVLRQSATALWNLAVRRA